MKKLLARSACSPRPSSPSALWFIQGWNGAGPAARPTAVVIAPGIEPVAAAADSSREPA